MSFSSICTRKAPSTLYRQPARSNSCSNQAAFSLIELVVVIAILSILVAIALPLFSGVRQEAKIAQLKNALATIVKECKIAQLRGKSTRLSDIPSARASVFGYQIISMGNLGSAALGGDCFQSYMTSGPPPYSNVYGITIGFVPVSSSGTLDPSAGPEFYLDYIESTGETIKSCYVDLAASFSDGCSGFDHYDPADYTNRKGEVNLPPDHGWGTW